MLENSRVWRAAAEEMAKEYPEVTYSNMLVDNAAMQLIKNPSQFDVIVTGNMFGDILSDEAAMMTGSIGMLPSASLGDRETGNVRNPFTARLRTLRGQGIANPMATIMSAAMMLRYSLDQMDCGRHNRICSQENSGSGRKDGGYRNRRRKNTWYGGNNRHGYLELISPCRRVRFDRKLKLMKFAGMTGNFI